MRKLLLSVFAVVMFLPLTTTAQDDINFDVNGLYTAWGQSQNDFKLGAADYKDEYFVQMFRLNFQFAYKDYAKAVTRFDLGQGWWGVDNVSPTYDGASGLFDNKETNYFLHVDQAYLWFKIPGLQTNMNVGRFKWALGNNMVLGNNLDGLSANVSLGDNNLKLGWAKVSEGVNGITDNDTFGPDPRGNSDGRDADLITAQYMAGFGKTDLEIYGAYYNDASTKDNTAYLIDGLRFNRPRFTPQVTQLTVFGVSGNSKLDKLNLTYEANYLTGKDDINNTTHAGPQNVPFGGTDNFKYDINNGDVSGYNVYVKADYNVSKKVTVGAVAGMGSGDDDPTSGEGNVNKIRTSGFFYMTEIWEDSIMPDEEGITPQGLGAPNIRGYRELENTTAFQVNGSVMLTPKWKVFGSFTYLQATEDVYAYANEVDLNTSASDLGWEVDFKTDYAINKKLTASFRTGYFAPGTAGQYLINGNDQNDNGAWELKTTITFKF